MKKRLIRDPLHKNGYREPFGMDEFMTSELVELPITKEFLDKVKRRENMINVVYACNRAGVPVPGQVTRYLKGH